MKYYLPNEKSLSNVKVVASGMIAEIKDYLHFEMIEAEKSTVLYRLTRRQSSNASDLQCIRHRKVFEKKSHFQSIQQKQRMEKNHHTAKSGSDQQKKKERAFHGVLVPLLKTFILAQVQIFFYILTFHNHFLPGTFCARLLSRQAEQISSILCSPLKY